MSDRVIRVTDCPTSVNLSRNPGSGQNPMPSSDHTTPDTTRCPTCGGTREKPRAAHGPGDRYERCPDPFHTAPTPDVCQNVQTPENAPESCSECVEEQCAAIITKPEDRVDAPPCGWGRKRETPRPMPDTDVLVATMRIACIDVEDAAARREGCFKEDVPRYAKGLKGARIRFADALEALASQLKEAREERDCAYACAPQCDLVKEAKLANAGRRRIISEVQVKWWKAEQRAEAAESKLARVTKERDDWKAATEMARESTAVVRRHAVAAEAKLARVTEVADALADEADRKSRGHISILAERVAVYREAVKEETL